MADKTTDAIWLTQEAFDKLQEEYAYLSEEGRPAIAAKIAAAREEGDLSENGGYHAAREEQGQMEARIRVLKHMLENASIGEPQGSADEVNPGTMVTIAFDGDVDDTEEFLLGSREMLALDDSVEVQVYSPQSPLGAAVLGAKVGDEVSYAAPNGRPIMVKVLAVGRPKH